ncbi:MAG: PhoH family protein [Clostridia bacterium]|nr:PhoH family protein [Clostridia bacterium]
MEKEILLNSVDEAIRLFGNFDENIPLIEKELGVKIFHRNGNVKVSGEEVAVTMAAEVLEGLLQRLKFDESLDEQTVRYLIGMAREGNVKSVAEIGGSCVCVTAKGKPIKPKTLGQKAYVENIAKNIVNLGIGPAGTGKTYLAVACAVTAFKNKEVSRIILTRPAIEAGEKLGFLPGDLQSKIDPYLRPLYDALFDCLGSDTFTKYSEKGLIEVAPLAYMRGRTLDDCFVILDEAQNTTPEQMKMFLTRIGFNTKAVITGDITQTDLPYGKKSGLKEAVSILKNIEGISITMLSHKDVVRHPLVQKIILAYEKHEQQKLRKSRYQDNDKKN